jgi:replicative DNA helicase
MFSQPRAKFQVVQAPATAAPELPLPNSPEAEEAVLGALLLDRETILTVAPVLKPHHFFSQERANFYQALLNLYAEQTPADLVTVKNALQQLGVLGDGEGQVRPAYILKLLNATPSSVHAAYYVEIVLKQWLARQLIAECTGTIASAYNPATGLEGQPEQKPLEPGELLAQHTTRLQALATSLTSLQPDYFLSHEISLEYFKKFDTQDENNDPWDKSETRPALRLGWPVFDGRDWAEPPALCLLPSTLTTILGRTGGGKTLAAMQIADANAKAGLNVLYFHVELNQAQMLARRYCRLAGVPVLPQLLKRLNEPEARAILQTATDISQWPGRVDFVHCPNWSGDRLVQELKARHYALMALKGQGYDLVVLDYLQRLGRSEQNSRAPEHEALAANVRAFSDCLNELNIAGLMTSQVGRDEAKAHEPPDVGEGLGTGDIERCSNQLLALAISEDRAVMKYAIRKNTFGEVGGSGELLYDARRLRLL